MTHAVRSSLFGLIILALVACQSPAFVNPTPVVPGSTDATPAGFALASIGGTVWHDLCDSGADGEPALTQTPPGCTQQDSALGRYHADGTRQAFEPGLPGVTVALLAGACPGGEALQTVLSDANGAYRFSGLDAGAHCVAIDPSSAANRAVLGPGMWTQPQVQEDMAAIVVNLHAGEPLSGVDFGWDEQYFPIHVHAAVWDNQGLLQVIDTGIALDTHALPTTGLSPQGGVAQSRIFVYASDSFHPTASVMMTTPDGLYQVAFIDRPDANLAVWPGQADQPAQLAWTVAPQSEGSLATIFVSDLAGTSVRAVYSETLQANQPTHLLVQGWAADGKTLLFSREPWGIGGYIPFGGASSLYRLNLVDGQVTPMIEWTPQGSTGLCLDALSPDGSLASWHCPPGEINLLTLDGGQTEAVEAPAEISQPYLTGSAIFSPDGSRVAYAMLAGGPDDQHGWVAVSDRSKGGSQAILDQEGGIYHVIAWLNNQSLLVQWSPVDCGDGCEADSLWTVGADGSGLAHIGPARFIVLTNAGQP